MLKLVCLFAVLAVAMADVRPVPVKADTPVKSEIQAPDTATDLDKAETYGFGYHKHIHAVPQFYGGGYGGYGGYGYGGYGGYHGGYLGGYHGGYYPYYGNSYYY